MGKNLFNESSDDEKDDLQLKTNDSYAKYYNEFRKKELYKKLKDRKKARGETDDSSSSDSESSDDDDDEGPVDPEFDKEFLKTLASLKSKDPSIYDKSTKFFGDITVENKQKTSNEKPLTLKDYERKVILEKGGVYVDDVSEDEYDRPISPTIAEEEHKLKEEFKKILQNEGSDEEGDFGGIFTKREKTTEEKTKEEADYLEWLAGRKDEIEEETKNKLDPLKKYWNKPDLSREDQFLRDYILNNGYINKENNTIPTYDEIVGNEDLSEDEKELEKQAEFEEKFNFRFEDPDKDFIKRYPRTIENSVRQKSEKRKEKRQELKERKQKEKEEKFKELEILKEMKRREIEEKIQKLKEVTGNEELPFNDDDLEEDFNPETYDRKMKEIFNENYYEVDEGEEKPECPDIEDLKVEDWDNFDPNNGNDDDRYNYEIDNENDEDIVDYDYDAKEELQKELIENTKGRRNRRKRRNRFMEMINNEKPPFDPQDEKTYADYIEEYYKMDCEDIIGDVPCRFKYVETVPNDFGLTIEEILLAKNKELNQWASFKKAVQIRPVEAEKRDVKLYKMRAKNEALKRKIFRSIYGPSSDEEEDTEEKPTENGSAVNPEDNNSEKKKKKRKKKKKNKNTANDNQGDSAVNLKKPEESSSITSKEVKKEKLETKSPENFIEKKNIENNEKKVTLDKETHKDENKESKTKKKKNFTTNNEEASSVNGSKLEKTENKDSVENNKRKLETTISENPMKKIKIEKKDKIASVEEKNNIENNKKQSKKKKKKEMENKKLEGNHDTNLCEKPKAKNNKKDTKEGNLQNRHKFKNHKEDVVSKISDDRLKAYGLNPSKFRRKHAYFNKISRNKQAINKSKKSNQ